MCGICGTFALKDALSISPDRIKKALSTLENRGPEVQDYFADHKAVLGHTRLSVIDTSDAANQPFCDPSNNYILVFNGEIYNFLQLREKLHGLGYQFRTRSDTEVLLYWLMEFGEKGIADLNGFFSFAFYDRRNDFLLIARDRMGIKPLYFHEDGTQFRFASELSALYHLDIPRKIDRSSLQIYFQFNYIPAPWTVYENVYKLLPGHFLSIRNSSATLNKYYEIKSNEIGVNLTCNLSYDAAKKVLRDKLTRSVEKRLVSDVPLGAFLSGGIDSSVIVALASKRIKDLRTFSIGFKDQPMFDETRYANLVANMHGTKHTVFHLTNQDLLSCLDEVLDYTSEPFADSSALAVYILSKHTRQQVTVSLSGDGADEMFAGYNKHLAHYLAMHGGIKTRLLKYFHPLLRFLPQSRNDRFSNRIRQFYRFGKGMQLPESERYWRWASFTEENDPVRLLTNPLNKAEYLERKKQLLTSIHSEGGMNQILQTDMNLVLPNDMLTKVDLMSMANSLEVRVPFLDHDVVNYVFQLPDQFKIDAKGRKKILRDTFRDDLPDELYQRSKQGFEVPLLDWFRGDLKERITDEWLNDDLIREQGIFNMEEINNLKKKLFSANPGEIHAQIWSIAVFQHWYHKYHKFII